jgi:hypothetical protein
MLNMTHNPGPDVTNDRDVIESNVRRIVGFTALRRIHKIIADRQEEDRVLRTLVAPIATILMIVIAALIWSYGSPRTDSRPAGPLPECAPPRGENITI